MSALVYIAHWALRLAVKYRADEMSCGVVLVMLFAILALIEWRKWTGVQGEEENAGN